MRRRTLLKRLGAVTAAGTIAGCLDDATTDGGDPGAGEDDGEADDGEDQHDGNEDQKDDGDGDDGGDGDEDVQATVTDSTVETIDADCGEGDDAAAEFGSESVTVTGAIEAPNPCHTATVEEATIDTGTLTAVVGLEETDDEVCTECVGLVEYEASIEVDGIGGVDEIVVSHVADGTRTEVERTKR